jgi:putative Mg2+ transporter-C (MgtC) family protein
MSAQLFPALYMLLHVAAACGLGWVVGYERYFHGRASGTQIYCLVCMASCALTQITGYPALWFGAQPGDPLTVGSGGTVTVIGSILQGIGFLGAGIIVKSGTSVRGLTTAASIWSSSAIGILVGVDFVALAIGLTSLFALCMGVIPAIERTLPARMPVLAILRYAEGQRPTEEAVLAYLKERHLRLVSDSLSVNFDGKSFELRFAVLTDSNSRSRSISRIAQDLARIPEVSSFSLEQTSRA